MSFGSRSFCISVANNILCALYREKQFNQRMIAGLIVQKMAMQVLFLRWSLTTLLFDYLMCILTQVTRTNFPRFILVEEGINI